MARFVYGEVCVGSNNSIFNILFLFNIFILIKLNFGLASIYCLQEDKFQLNPVFCT